MANESDNGVFSRRDILGGLGAITAGLLLNASGAQTAAAAEANTATSTSMMGYDAAKGEYVLPPLPYDYAALEPSIDAKTMEIHHNIHAKGYVTGLNNALKKLAEARKAGDYALVKNWSREVAFNGSGHALHTIFWNNMAPASQGGGGEPPADLAKALETSFGSVEMFRKQFSAAAGAVEGSGWGILAYEPMSGNLIILQAEKHQNLTLQNVKPLLVLDVWEHAYYLKYQNRRPEYVKAWWDVVNWSDVAARLKA